MNESARLFVENPEYAKLWLRRAAVQREYVTVCKEETEAFDQFCRTKNDQDKARAIAKVARRRKLILAESELSRQITRIEILAIPDPGPLCWVVHNCTIATCNKETCPRDRPKIRTAEA